MSEFVSNYTGSEIDTAVKRKVGVFKFENLSTTNGIYTLNFSNIGNVILLNAWVDQRVTSVRTYVAGGGSNYIRGNNYWLAKLYNEETNEQITSGTYNIYVAFVQVV